MPRIAEARDAAAPNSSEQHARFERILAAAAELATEKELDRVQMGEVARLAGVAVATLYRYFPSKTHLFVGVMLDQIERLSTTLSGKPRSNPRPADAVHATLTHVVRALLRRPLLATAMIQANSMARASVVPDTSLVDRHFHQLLYDAAGIEQATEREGRQVRLVIHAFFGIIQSCLNGRLTVSDVELDLRNACDLLLADWPQSAPADAR